jgi:hypothetical protein
MTWTKFSARTGRPALTNRARAWIARDQPSGAEPPAGRRIHASGTSAAPARRVLSVVGCGGSAEFVLDEQTVDGYRTSEDAQTACQDHIRALVADNRGACARGPARLRHRAARRSFSITILPKRSVLSCTATMTATRPSAGSSAGPSQSIVLASARGQAAPGRGKRSRSSRGTRTTRRRGRPDTPHRSSPAQRAEARHDRLSHRPHI